MDNVILNRELISSDDSSSSSEEEGNSFGDNTMFMSNVQASSYERNRNKLFTKDIIKKKIVVDSHNYFQAENDFNTSNFDVLFDFEKKPGSDSSSLITTNYDIYHNVIGFRLLKTTIRTPPYNVNKTNNIIKYKSSATGDTIHTLTINPGQYEVGELAEVFQNYYERVNTINSVDVRTNYSQFCTYTDTRVDNVSNSATLNQDTSSYANTPHSFKMVFNSTDETSLGLLSGESNRNLKSLIFKIEYFGDADSSEEVTILWDYNNITRGAARLLGFLPKSTTTSSRVMFSNRLLDVSSHFVDLVIPEIPSIACKRNSSGRDIIERIQLKANHGEYLHFRTAEIGKDAQIYFNPIKLHRINIQLWAVNNELYDTNNSDVSFEFEITMLKNIGLLR